MEFPCFNRCCGAVAAIFAFAFCNVIAFAGPVPLRQSNPADLAKTNFPVRKISENIFGIGDVRLDSKTRSITFPASVNMTNGIIEYLLVSARGKLHESLLKTDVEPMQVHSAKLLLDPKTREPQPLIAGPNATNAVREIVGDAIRISLSWRIGGEEKTFPAEDLVFNRLTQSPMTRGKWIYTGSRFVEGTFMAQRERSLISLIADPDALVENPRLHRDRDDVWQVNSTNVPPLNTAVNVTIQFETKSHR
jgi:hypothetical protein